MSNYISSETKRLYTGLLGDIDNVKTVSIGGRKSESVRSLFDEDLLRFLLCLAVTDGEIGKGEIDFLYEFLPQTMKREFPASDRNSTSLSRAIRQYALSSGAYRYARGSVPFALKFAQKIDEQYIAGGEASQYTVTKKVCDLYEALGSDFLALSEDLNTADSYTVIVNFARDQFRALTEGIDLIKGEGSERSPEGSPAESWPPKEEGEKEEEAPAEPEKTVEELLAELDELVGLENVKQEVHSMVNLINIRKLRQSHGLVTPALSLHMVFYGNPGTGKTTVARLLAKIYKAVGVLSKGQLVEVDRSGLVAGYVGQTAIKTQKVIESAIGGILFIDEAYSLINETSGQDFGQEAIVTILKAMEDRRDDFIVIVAGYTELMEKFIASNPGLKSRFNKYIEFYDYTPGQLVDIFKLQCRKAGYEPTEEALKYTEDYFADSYENRGEDYANGREVRNYLEKAIVNQANRLSERESDEEPTEHELLTLELADVNIIE
jgi:SpoVK/Ycf46/Vps4 family AAA+-type ATPase